jgi:dipeptidyl aminopeptidase/acylaminoacyl peptidase
VHSLQALLKVPQVDPYGGFALSPDGSQIAFSWNKSGTYEIWMARLDGRRPAVPLTSGPGAKGAPRWSADGRRLAYTVDWDGSEAYDLFVHDFESASQINLTPDTPAAIQPGTTWSPDSCRLAFASNRSGHFCTYFISVDGAAVRLALDTPYPDSQVHWSPDGEWLAVVATTEGQDYGTFIVSALAGPQAEPRRISVGGCAICAKDVAWAPGSDELAFASDLSGRFQIGVYSLATGDIRWLTTGETDHETPAWAPNGRRLVCVASQGPESSLALIDRDLGCVERAHPESGICYGPAFTPDGEQIVFLFESPQHPCDLWLHTPTTGGFHAITSSLPESLSTYPFSQPSLVRYPSLDPEVAVPALLYRPGGLTEPGPAVIYIHGGPDWLAQVNWDPVIQAMVGQGWTVLAPNYRGSTGYGRGWQLANRFDLGGCDTRDVAAGADYLVHQRLADPHRIAVTGRSWGGYLTMTCLTQYPDRWAGGSAVVPFLNFFTAHANSRDDLQHWDLENMGDPVKDGKRYRERSPYFFLDRVRAPVQLIAGAHDVRCPAGESIQASDRLHALGKHCELLLYPDEGHTFLKHQNRLDVEARRMAFLSRALAAPRPEGPERINK